MITKKTLPFILLLTSSLSQANTFKCVNSVVLSKPLSIQLSTDDLLASDEFSNFCQFDKDKEIIDDKNYEGWLKFVPGTRDQKDLCANLKAVFHRKQRKIYHLILDKNIQDNRKGFVQIAYESYGREYGPKIIKSFLKCFPN